MKRSAGILLPIFSLPSNYGIGTFGKEAYKFVDFLDKSGQSYWQILPLGQTSYGDSPYQSFSSFAGNPYFIDLDVLVEDGLLENDDLKDLRNDSTIDYAYLFETRFTVLYKAYLKGKISCFDEFNDFCNTNNWLEDYALFMALKKHFNNKSWIDWEDEDIRKRTSESLSKYKELLKDDIEFYKFIQYLFFKQYEKLKAYANSKNILIIGDIPIYVSLDSCEVWAEPKNFLLDENYLPKEVSGVPPDYFNENGQLWGNPLYDYDYQELSNYDWWVKRINGTAKLFDVLRIDHFRGFESFWAVPYGETTAKNGKWVKGPGMRLLGVIKEKCKEVDFISEDLGYHTPEVEQLLADFGYPGMKVLEFAFDSTEPSDHMPHNFTENYVCYVGTHDNETVMQYLNNPYKDIERAKKYIGYSEEEGFNFSMIRCGMESVAKLFITQMQDYLGLGEEGRINTPGVLGGNWTWRMEKDAASEELALKIRDYTYLYVRGK